MKLGLFTPVFQERTLAAMLIELQRYPEIEALEIGTGGWPGSKHLGLQASGAAKSGLGETGPSESNLDHLLASSEAVRAYRSRIEDAGLSISALSCHGNPLHPRPEIAERDDVLFRKTVQLAQKLEVPVVVTFSGCPGGSPEDQTPNWIVTGWPPEYAEALAWQWEEKLIPYWRNAAAFAADSGVKVALEAHPGFSVYNTDTLLSLRAEAGFNLGINLDPSHLWWQGIEIPAAIQALGEAIFHVHAKDVAFNPAMRDRNGVLDPKSFRDVASRSWLFRSVGWGHGELEWKQIVSALRIAGYDYVLSIEHEDALASIHEGLSSAVAMLTRVLLKEPPVKAWWA